MKVGFMSMISKKTTVITVEEPAVTKTKEGAIKYMLVVFFDLKVNVYWEFVAAGVTVNSYYYCGI